MMLIKGNTEMLKYLNKAKQRGEYVAYFTEDDKWDGVQVAPPGSFGSIIVRPPVEVLCSYDSYDPHEFEINDTRFESDYNKDTEFIVYDKDDVIHMIKILMKCL